MAFSKEMADGLRGMALGGCAMRGLDWAFGAPLNAGMAFSASVLFAAGAYLFLSRTSP